MNQISLLIIGDPHFRDDNLSEVDQFTDFVLSSLKKYKPHLTIILGDVLHHHQRIESAALNRAYDFIKQLPNVIVLVGNHDMYNNQQFLNQNHWMNCLKGYDNIAIVDKPLSINIKNFNLCFCPYVQAGRLKEALTDIDIKKQHIFFLHQEMQGCQMGAITSTEGDEWMESYPPIVSGHIHGKQRVQNNIYYPGSAMQHAFGECSNKSLLLLTLSTEEDEQKGDLFHPYNNVYYYYEEIPHCIGMKKIVYLTLDEVKKFSIPLECKTKVVIKDEIGLNQFKAFKKTKTYERLVEAGVKVIFKAIKEKKDREEKKEMLNFHQIFYNLLSKEEQKFVKEEIGS